MALRASAMLVLAPLAGCLAMPPAESARPAFDPIAFFAGDTAGEGRLRIAFHRAVVVRVRGHGVVDAGGALTLGQSVTQGDEQATDREWRIARTAPGRYAGTLTDAVGRVDAAVSGTCLRVRFAMRHGLRAEQAICVQPGGRLALNRLTVRKFGVPVAILDERITRVAPGA